MAVDYFRMAKEVRLDPDNAQWYRRANAELKEPPPEVVRVVFVGDSDIERWEQLPELPGCQLVNRGCGGEATAQLLLRLDQDVLQLRPAVAVLALGGNDLTSIGVLPEREKEIVEACTKNLLEAADRMHARGIHVVLLTVFPVGQVGLSRRPVWSDATLAAVAEVNRALR